MCMLKVLGMHLFQKMFRKQMKCTSCLLKNADLIWQSTHNFKLFQRQVVFFFKFNFEILAHGL